MDATKRPAAIRRALAKYRSLLKEAYDPDVPGHLRSKAWAASVKQRTAIERHLDALEVHLCQGSLNL